jgi:hypothetical protein
MNSNMAIYVPNGAGWKPSTAGAEGYTKWGSDPEIPYVDKSYGMVHLTDAAQNDPVTMWAKRRGDICQYMGTIDDDLKGYRMPINGEFGTTTAFNQEGWTHGGTAPDQNNTLGNAYGTTDLVNTHDMFYVKNTIINGGIIFPASGYRYYGSGALGMACRLAAYPSATSPGDTSKEYLLHVERIGGVATLNTQASTYRSYALPIRCVVDD